MKKLLMASLLTVGLAGCGTLGLDGDTRLIVSKSVVTVSDSVDAAERLGKITPEEELELQNKLLVAHDLFSGRKLVFGDVPQCADDATRFECMDSILDYVDEYIANKENKENE